jgi:hypothetical protein
MTTEQAEAFAQPRTLAAASRLRVRPDDEGWPIIPGRLGQIEYHDGRSRAAWSVFGQAPADVLFPIERS